ncbi:hypothetical protein MMC34_006259 [Xylographa carneopallida]|nr:hypothetical protein [Xylographa carneopallida]
MADKKEEILKRPLYVFDLPHELLLTLELKEPSFHSERQADDANEAQGIIHDGNVNRGTDQPGGSTACGLCNISFSSLTDQRRHVKSDWHGYNLKQKLRGLNTVNEVEFERLVGDLDESISGSDSSSSEDEDDRGAAKESTLSALLKKQARLHDTTDVDVVPQKKKRGSGSPPLIWFSCPLLPSNTSLGIYRALFTNSEQQNPDMLDLLRKKQLKSAQVKSTQNGSNGVPLPASMTGPNVFLCMIGGGHFAAMIVSLTPKMGKKATGIEERQAIVIAHKTFHRYTTRRKQGGSQSANDSAKGAAHSAGAGIRRYNEVALETEVRALLSEWKNMIDGSELLFVRATGTTNKRTLFGPYEGQFLRPNDPRVRSFPFSTRRATQAELMRAFVELTRMKVSEVDEAALAAAAAEEQKRSELATKSASTPSKPVVPKISKDEETALLHTSQIQALIRRSKAPAVLSYISQNSISPDFIFYPSTQANHHASTPLHLAASLNSPTVVLALLTKAGADPTAVNGEGKPPFDIAGDRATRDAFRVARSELGEEKWKWDEAHCPGPLSKAEADEREASGRAESQKVEAERRKAETERLERETAANSARKPPSKTTGKPLGVTERTAAEVREQEGRGLTPEMRAKLERERRARAAEERMRRMASGATCAGAGR